MSRRAQLEEDCELMEAPQLITQNPIQVHGERSGGQWPRQLAGEALPQRGFSPGQNPPRVMRFR